MITWEQIYTESLLQFLPGCRNQANIGSIIEAQIITDNTIYIRTSKTLYVVEATALENIYGRLSLPH